MHGHNQRKKVSAFFHKSKLVLQKGLIHSIVQDNLNHQVKVFSNHFGMFYGWPKPDWTDRSQLDNLINLINKARFSISRMSTSHSRYWLDFVIAKCSSKSIGFLQLCLRHSQLVFPRGKTTLFCSRQNLNGYHQIRVRPAVAD